MRIEPVIQLTPLPDHSDWFLLESTAPTDVDGKSHVDNSGDMDEQIDAFVNQLLQSHEDKRHVIIFVHGYSNNRKAVLDRIYKAASTTADPQLSEKGTTYIGYHWPSEQIFAPSKGLALGLTDLLWLAFATSLLLIAASLSWPLQPRWQGTLAWTGFFSSLGVVLLRLVVYYRDSYRASNYGVLDLVEFVRRLDLALYAQLKDKPEAKRVSISFVGHSMGGFVVTNALRILTDVFDASSVRRVTSQQKTAADQTPTNQTLDFLPLTKTLRLPPNQPARSFTERPNPDLGKTLTLQRLVLVSPDIPAAALVTGRANFLGPSIRRCSEAYLFSNGGDVVLSLISKTANYFVFPSIHASNAARLGNVQLVSTEPGIGTSSAPMRSIRLGNVSLAKIQNACSQTELSEYNEVSNCFTYVDCTGFHVGNRRISLSNGNGPINFPTRLLGLAQYFINVVRRKGTDCHSGYFNQPELRRLIFGSAAVGLTQLTFEKEPDTYLEDIGLRLLPGTTLGLQRKPGTIKETHTLVGSDNYPGGLSNQNNRLPS